MPANLWNTDWVTKSRDIHSVYMSAKVSHYKKHLNAVLRSKSEFRSLGFSELAEVWSGAIMQPLGAGRVTLNG